MCSPGSKCAVCFPDHSIVRDVNVLGENDTSHITDDDLLKFHKSIQQILPQYLNALKQNPQNKSMRTVQCPTTHKVHYQYVSRYNQFYDQQPRWVCLKPTETAFNNLHRLFAWLCKVNLVVGPRSVMDDLGLVTQTIEEEKKWIDEAHADFYRHILKLELVQEQFLMSSNM